MKKYLKTAAVLTMICAVSAILLALVNKITAPVIASYEANQVLQALEEVSNGMEIGEKQEIGEGAVDYVYPLMKDGKPSGFILGLKATGYGGEMTLVGSFDLKGTILGAKMLTNSETPGLGKKSESASYMDKFISTGGATAVPTNKNMLNSSDAASVSGASMTFTGIAKALAAGSQYVVTKGGK